MFIFPTVLRWMLLQQNDRLENGGVGVTVEKAERERVEVAARLEGLTFEEALERKRKVRFLY